jgi:hypothetical protein
MFQGQGQLQGIQFYLLPAPALVPANASSILAAMSSLNEFDHGWKLSRASFTSNQAQPIGKTSLDDLMMVWVPLVTKDGTVVVFFHSNQLLFKNKAEQ